MTKEFTAKDKTYGDRQEQDNILFYQFQKRLEGDWELRSIRIFWDILHNDIVPTHSRLDYGGDLSSSEVLEQYLRRDASDAPRIYAAYNEVLNISDQPNGVDEELKERGRQRFK